MKSSQEKYLPTACPDETLLMDRLWPSSSVFAIASRAEETQTVIIIAGKNNIAVHGLELALKHFPAQVLAVVCNRNEGGVDTWQRSLRAAAKRHGVQEITLDDAYKTTRTAFLSLEFDQLVVPRDSRYQISSTSTFRNCLRTRACTPRSGRYFTANRKRG